MTASLRYIVKSFAYLPQQARPARDQAASLKPPAPSRSAIRAQTGEVREIIEQRISNRRDQQRQQQTKRLAADDDDGDRAARCRIPRRRPARAESCRRPARRSSSESAAAGPCSLHDCFAAAACPPPAAILMWSI